MRSSKELPVKHQLPLPTAPDMVRKEAVTAVSTPERVIKGNGGNHESTRNETKDKVKPDRGGRYVKCSCVCLVRNHNSPPAGACAAACVSTADMPATP